MSNKLEKTSTSSSSLSVVEKKSEKEGGCVGIFFQLFNWNRRLAKKKLISKKLLPPVRSKQASKKFGGDEKQPKLRLISDENSGGFPKNNIKNELPQQETRAPGLIARLMGLESMPALHREKSKNIPSSSHQARPKSDKIVDTCHNGCTMDGPLLEKGIVMHNSRPQKLQRTIASERQPVAKFGPDKLPPFRSVVSKSRKHQYHPKLASPLKSPRNFPSKRPSKLIGAASRILGPSSRSKGVLTYTDSLGRHPSQDIAMDKRAHLLSGLSGDSGGFAGVAANWQSSCRNCGYLLDSLGSKYAASEKPLIFDSPVANCEGGAACYQQNGDSLQSRVKLTQYKMPFSVPVHRNPDGQICKPLEALPFAFNLCITGQSGTHMFQEMASVPLRAKWSTINGSKKLSSSSSTRMRLPACMENGEFKMEKRISNGLKGFVPPRRKRRPANVSRQVESAGFISSKRFFCSSHVMPGKQLGYNAHIVNGKNGLQDSVVSLSFNSQVKYNRGTKEDAERRNKYDSGENGGRVKMERPLPLPGDALDALLQQKLKELNYEGDNFESKESRKTTSMQELMYALTSKKQFQEDNILAFSDGRNRCCNDSMLVNSSSCTSPKSCHSTSLDESLACKMRNDPDLDLLDSAARKNNQATNNNKIITYLINHVSEILSYDFLTSCGLKGNKLGQAQEALLNSELILHHASISGGFMAKGCPIKHLIVDNLETLASVLWMNFSNSLGIEDGKDANQLKVFVFDSVIEFLERRFGRYREYGSKMKRKLPVRVNTNMLIFEITDVVRGWDELSRHGTLDELVEREMGFSSRDWTECESEGVETGLAIGGYVLQVLVDEVVVDLLKYGS